MQLEPTVIRLTPTERAAIMSLRNRGTEPLHVQVRTFRWDQVGGEDRLNDTDALRVSPPIQEIPPGGEQIVRVLLAEDRSPLGEETYRLILDELPDGTAAAGKVRILVRYSIPVTLRPANLPPPELWFGLRLTDGVPALESRNSGGRGARLSRVRLNREAGDPIEINAGLLGYVLAGRLRRWRLESLTITDVAHYDEIVVDVDGQPETFPLDVLR